MRRGVLWALLLSFLLAGCAPAGAPAGEGSGQEPSQSAMAPAPEAGTSAQPQPAPEPEPDISSLPVYSEQTKTDTIALPRDNSGVDNTNLTNRVGFDPKNLYRNVKRLLVKLDEYGDNLFLQPEARVGFVSPHDPRTCA